MARPKKNMTKSYKDTCFSLDADTYTAFAEKTGKGKRTRVLEELMKLYNTGVLDGLVNAKIDLDGAKSSD